MGNKSSIIERYRPTGIISGSELLLEHTDALNFIKDCRKLELVILGMDFYAQKGNEIVQLNSADYSSISQQLDAVEQSTTAAWKLVENNLPEDASRVSFVLRDV